MRATHQPFAARQHKAHARTQQRGVGSGVSARPRAPTEESQDRSRPQGRGSSIDPAPLWCPYVRNAGPAADGVSPRRLEFRDPSVPVRRRSMTSKRGTCGERRTLLGRDRAYLQNERDVARKLAYVREKFVVRRRSRHGAGDQRRNSRIVVLMPSDAMRPKQGVTGHATEGDVSAMIRTCQSRYCDCERRIPFRPGPRTHHGNMQRARAA